MVFGFTYTKYTFVHPPKPSKEEFAYLKQKLLEEKNFKLQKFYKVKTDFLLTTALLILGFGGFLSFAFFVDKKGTHDVAVIIGMVAFIFGFSAVRGSFSFIGYLLDRRDYFSLLMNKIRKTENYIAFLKENFPEDYYAPDLSEAAYNKFSDDEIVELLATDIISPNAKFVLNKIHRERNLEPLDKQPKIGGLTFFEISKFSEDEYQKHLLKLNQQELDLYHNEFLKHTSERNSYFNNFD